MSNFPEPNLPAFVPVYQLQRTDPVDAGAAGEGPSNLPIKNLVERTAYLKKEVEDLDTSLGGLVIGSTVQAYDADLAAIAALNTNGVVARTGAGTATIRPTGTAGLAVLAAADEAAARTAIAVPPINNPSFTGNVGIGTSSPGAKLDVSGGDALVHGVCVGRGGGSISSNTATGYIALYSNTTGTDNTATGYIALYSNTTGSINTANGAGALYRNTTGTNNTANGVQALHNNTTGTNNTANGVLALSANTTGTNNTANGANALYSNTTGSGNIGFGFVNSSGNYVPVFNPTTENNRIVMGHTSVTNAYVQVAWTVVSDARDKTQIEPLNLGLDFVERLNPVSFKFRVSRDSEQTNGGKHYGFLAQEVLTIEGENPVIVDTEDPEKLKMTSEELIPILVNAIQELKAEFDAYKASHP